MTRVVEMTLQLPEGREWQVARQCFAQLRPEDWGRVVRFAAAVVALQESVSQGTAVLVVPASRQMAESMRPEEWLALAEAVNRPGPPGNTG